MVFASSDTLTTIEECYVTALKRRLGNFDCIQVHHEIGLPISLGVGHKRTRIRFAFGSWLTTYPIQMFLTSSETDAQRELIEDTDYVVTAADGYIDLKTGATSTFSTAGDYGGELPPGCQIEGTYRFSFFTDVELRDLLLQALNAVNMRPPATAYQGLGDAPAEFINAIISYANLLVINRILMDMNFWNNRFIFADSDGSVNFTQSILQTQATALESRVDLEAKFAKPRGLVVPKGITGSRFNTQTRVTAANFSTFFSIS